MSTHVSFVNVSRDFGPVRVLHDVSFDVARGEVRALIGENGAGKSTLMRILGGHLEPSAGEVRLEGRRVRFRDSREAEAAGVVVIHQEFNLAEELTVSENVFLGRELTRGALLDTAAMNAQAARVLESVGLRLDSRTRVRELIVPHRQLVEIARALSRDARLLVMDEPTATLTPTETRTLFALIDRLRERGVTVVYISHKLEEVQRIADTVTVLRDGRVVATQPVAGLSQHEMANLMVGREIEDMFPPRAPASEAAEMALEVRGLTVPGWARDVSFGLRRGEILGFAGLVGAGRTELFEGLLGLRARSGGSLLVRGRPVTIRSPQDAARAGLVYLSEDRKGKGLHVDFRLRPNLTLMALERFARPLLDRGAEQRALERAVGEYGIRAGSLEARAGALSGGNQQKLAVAKIMQVDPEIVVLDEPTRGVDVGAKREIYFLVASLVAAGKSVIVVSSDLPELLGLAHRVVVMHQGRVTGVLEGEHLNETEVIQHATGLKGGASHPGASTRVAA